MQRVEADRQIPPREALSRLWCSMPCCFIRRDGIDVHSPMLIQGARGVGSAWKAKMRGLGSHRTQEWLAYRDEHQYENEQPTDGLTREALGRLVHLK